MAITIKKFEAEATVAGQVCDVAFDGAALSIRPRVAPTFAWVEAALAAGAALVPNGDGTASLHGALVPPTVPAAPPAATPPLPPVKTKKKAAAEAPAAPPPSAFDPASIGLGVGTPVKVNGVSARGVILGFVLENRRALVRFAPADAAAYEQHVDCDQLLRDPPTPAAVSIDHTTTLVLDEKVVAKTVAEHAQKAAEATVHHAPAAAVAAAVEKADAQKPNGAANGAAKPAEETLVLQPSPVPREADGPAVEKVAAEFALDLPMLESRTRANDVFTTLLRKGVPPVRLAEVVAVLQPKLPAVRKIEKLEERIKGFLTTWDDED